MIIPLTKLTLTTISLLLITPQNYTQISLIISLLNFITNPNILKLSLIPLLYILLLLFSAPLNTQTLLISLLLSSSLNPRNPINPAKKANITNQNLDSYFSFLSSLNYTPVITTWISSIVLPLDWNKPWQEYPYFSCVGCLFGCVILSVYDLFVAKKVWNKDA